MKTTRENIVKFSGESDAWDRRVDPCHPHPPRSLSLGPQANSGAPRSFAHRGLPTDIGKMGIDNTK